MESGKIHWSPTRKRGGETRPWNVGHHNGPVTRVKRSLAILRLTSAVVLAAWAFVSRTIIKNMPNLKRGGIFCKNSRDIRNKDNMWNRIIVVPHSREPISMHVSYRRGFIVDEGVDRSLLLFMVG